MAKEVIYKVKIDVGDSAKSIKQVEDEFAAVVKRVKEAKVGSEAYIKALEELEAVKQELRDIKAEFNLIQKGAVKSLGGINEEVNFAETSFGELLKLQKQLKAEFLLLSRADENYEKIKNQLQEVNKEVAAFNRELRGSRTLQENITLGVQEALRVINDENKSVQNLNDSLKELKVIQSQVAIGSEDFKKISKAINDIETELKQANGQFEEVNKNLKGISSEIAGLGDIVSQGFGLQIAAQSAGELIAEFKDLVIEVDKVNTAVKNTFGTIGDRTEEIAGRILGLTRSFDLDLNKTIESTNAISKQFGISVSEALSLIEQGFIAGADTNGEFLDVLREYPAQLKLVGLSAEQFIAIQTKAATSGVFNDKAVDAVKEAGISLREQTKATRDAIVALFGQSVGDELLNAINSGEITIADAIARISTELNKLPDQSKVVGQVLADVFKAAGEDAGITFIKSLKDIDQGLNSVIDKSSEAFQVELKRIKANQELAKVQSELAKLFTSKEAGIFFTFLKTEGLRIILETSKVYKALFKDLGEIAKAFGLVSKDSDGATGAIKLFGTVAKLFVENATRPTRLLIQAFDTLAQIIETVTFGFVDLRRESEKSKGIFDQLSEGLNTFTFGLLGTSEAERNAAQATQTLADQQKQLQEQFGLSAKEADALIIRLKAIYESGKTGVDAFESLREEVKKFENETAKARENEEKGLGLPVMDKAAQNQALEDQKEFLAQVEALRRQASIALAQINGEDTEASLELQKQYELEALRQQKEFQELQKTDVELAAALENEIIQKYEAEKLEIIKAANEKLSQEIEAQIQRELDSEAKGFERRLNQINAYNNQKKIDVNTAYLDELSQLQTKFENDLITEQEFNEQKAELNAVRDADLLAAQEEYLNAQINLAVQQGESIAELEEQLLENEVARNELALQEKQRIADQEAAINAVRKQNSANLTQSLIGFIGSLSETNKQFANLQKALFVFEKAKAIADIIINSQVAIAKAQTLLPPLSTIESIKIGASAALGIATVGAQAVTGLQQFGSGGIINGASHSRGGVNVNAEGGEVIINKRSSAMFLPALSAINQLGGGVPLMPSNKRRAALGTMVAPSVRQDQLLTPESIAQALQAANIVVSVTEIAEVQNRVRVLEQVAVDR